MIPWSPGPEASRGRDRGITVSEAFEPVLQRLIQPGIALPACASRGIIARESLLNQMNVKKGPNYVTPRPRTNRQKTPYPPAETDI